MATNVPSSLTNVYLYILNTDGSITAVNSNNAVNITITYGSTYTTISYVADGTTYTYTARTTSAGLFQTDNSTVSLATAGSTAGTSVSYLYITNDQISDTSKVTWANQAGNAAGSTAYPTYVGASSSIILTQSTDGSTISLDKSSTSYSSTSHNAAFTSTPTVYSDVFMYILNADGTITTINNNNILDVTFNKNSSTTTITYSVDGTTYTYTANNSTTNTFQSENSFVALATAGSTATSSVSYLYITNDQIVDTANVTWANQAGNAAGSTAYPSYVGVTTDIILKRSTDGASASVTKNNTNYTSTAHNYTLSSYLPSSLTDVYLYTLYPDGTVTALVDNVPTNLTITYDGTNVNISYTDGSGTLVTTTYDRAGMYESENGFVVYTEGTGYILISNDIIEDPTNVKWTNESGKTPSDYTNQWTDFTADSSKITLSSVNGESASGTVSLDYNKPAGASSGGGGVTNDGSYDSSIHIEMPCFLSGTIILTKDGYKLVENLNLNDQIAIIQNGKVTWSAIKALAVGRRKTSFHPFPDVAGYPVRITKGAIAPGIPFKDLLVTHDHALFIDGKLLLARTLVDDEKIFFDKNITEYNFYHIDLYDHVIIEADGLQVESFNRKSHEGIFGDLQVSENLSFNSTKVPKEIEICTNPEIIKNIRCKIGLKNNQVEKIGGISFDLTDNFNRKITKRKIKDNLYSFTLPPGVDEVKIVSDVFRPYDVIGSHVDDRRQLGVLVEKVTLIERNNLTVQKKYLQEQSSIGWSMLENPNCRWTTGNAILNLNRKNPEKQGVLLIKFLNEVN